MPEAFRTMTGRLITPSMKVAIKTADRLADFILADRRDILCAIISRRVKPETFDVIAEEEAELLGGIGATTFHVRKAIVARVCNATLAEQIHTEIKNELLLARPVHETTPKMLQALQRGAEKGVHPWTPELDQLLLQLAETVLRENAPKKGYTDWKKIAEIMQKDYGITLKTDQWKGHVLYLKKLAIESSQD